MCFWLRARDCCWYIGAAAGNYVDGRIVVSHAVARQFFLLLIVQLIVVLRILLLRLKMLLLLKMLLIVLLLLFRVVVSHGVVVEKCYNAAGFQYIYQYSYLDLLLNIPHIRHHIGLYCN